MNKTMKFVMVLMVAIMLVSVVVPVLAAGSGVAINPDDLENAITYGDSTKVQSLVGRIMGIIRNIAIIASVVILMVVGVKFMMGSTEEKAEYKKSLVPLIVGIVLVIGATSIASFIFNTLGL